MTLQNMDVMNNKNKTPDKYLFSSFKKRKDYLKDYGKDRYKREALEYAERYQLQKLEKDKNKSLLSKDIYKAIGVKIVVGLRDYLNSGKHARQLWHEFSQIVKNINKIGVSDIVWLVILRETLDKLISDYYSFVNGQERGVKERKKWDKLTEQQRKRAIWEINKKLKERETLIKENFQELKKIVKKQSKTKQKY